MITRSNELKKLETEYASPDNSIVFIYGRKGCDKEALFNSFTKNKEFFYYRARQCSDEKQLNMFCSQVEERFNVKTSGNSYDEVLASISINNNSKLVIIIDEIQYMIKKETDALSTLVSLKNNNLNSGKFMIVIASSSIVWSENTFDEIPANLKKEINHRIKLEDLTFLDIVRAFPAYSVAECVSMYGIIGGVSSYLDIWNGKKSIKENVCTLILNKQGLLFDGAEAFISTELRELSCYETIIASIAAGNEKLNDLFEDTGYSRAKISVYMKNLTAFDVIDKAVSFETGGWDNTKKGVYRISNPFIHFWFTFVYPNLSMLYTMAPESFYDKYIAPGLDEYLQHYFVNVCREYLHLLNTIDQLNIKLVKIGTWIGKEGTIDIIGQSSNRENVVGICNWNQSSMSYETYELLLESMKKARISANTIYLFSATRFDEKLTELSAKDKNVVLVDMKEL